MRVVIYEEEVVSNKGQEVALKALTSKATYLGIATEINRNKRNPYDTRCVHGEADEFGFVEVFGHVSRLQRI